MNSQIKVCQNCKQEFIVEPDDFAFYEKIKVPPPTFCPNCRFQRRLAFFNLTSLYRRKCDLCGEMKISMYAPDAPYKVYCPQCWWSDKWDPLEYGRDYDFSRPFFDQFDELLRVAPLLGLSIDLQVAALSPHNNHAGHLKNCYMLFQADFDEDCAYGVLVVRNKTMLDSSICLLCELCYDTMNIFKSNRCVGTRGNLTESLDCAFLRDCDNCQNCFASANLRNEKFHIFNKPYAKEEYFSEIRKWDLGSYKTYQEVKRLAEAHWRKLPPRPKYDDFSTNCTGSYVFESKNCKECFEVTGAEDSKYIFMIGLKPVKDTYDFSSWGNNASLCYECSVAGENISHLRFCQESGLNLHSAEYCKLSTGGSYHFGCVSMKKGDYCILNKRYAEEEFHELRKKIIEHMNTMPYVDKKGRKYPYGEFFPIERSPFPYNDTVAQRFFPLSKEGVTAQGWQWREPDIREYTITKPARDLPDHIKDAPDSVLQEVLGCGTCPRGFKIIPMELDFLRKMNLPLPRRCPFCRINEKFDIWVKNLRVIPRTCSKCGADFTTHYTKEDTEYILCKKCYLEGVV
ncbi:MAG: hypothetical protein HY436_01805 [Candidatus Liptonbacteria bacterium]|nr:hypothetical protein [Candidatus Liptonbacteria bacterium]